MLAKLASFCLYLAALLSINGCRQSITEVETSYGPLRGLTDGIVSSFFGIPYAKPPLDELRWQPPQPPTGWSKTKLSVLPKAGCIQMSTPTETLIQSEDCLNLNIWAPSKPGPHPVMVWFHGGAFLMGSNTPMMYSGKQLAKQKDVVVVTINYRLGFLGHLSLPQLSGETGYSASGNQGFLDQQLALQWVHDEIANFGGDPDNVTLFGQSAGGVSILQQMASPLSNHLFHKAIVMSGPFGAVELNTLEESESIGFDFAEAVGCSDPELALECLRALPATTIRSRLQFPEMELFKVSFNEWKFKPTFTIDNHFIPSEPYQEIISGNTNHIPVMIGSVKDEGSFFEAFKNHSSDETGYLAELKQRYGSKADDIASYYPYSNYRNAGAAFSAISGDELLVCGGIEWGRRLSLSNHTVHFYHFTQPIDSMMNALFLPFKGENSPSFGTFHVGEIPYVFGLSNPSGFINTAERKLTSTHMMNFWTNFARTGNPNSIDLPDWPAFSDKSAAYLELGPGFQARQDLRVGTCEAWAYNRW